MCPRSGTDDQSVNLALEDADTLGKFLYHMTDPVDAIDQYDNARLYRVAR